MGKPAAKKGDRITANDTHIVLVTSPAGPVPTPMPFSFVGALSESLSESTFIDEQPAAIEGSEAQNAPAHVPTGGSFQSPPSNKGTVNKGSATVFVDGKGMAREGDVAITCNDPTDAPLGVVKASGTVLVGD